MFLPVQGVSFSRALMPFQAKGSAGRRGPFGRAALDACPPAPHIYRGAVWLCQESRAFSLKSELFWEWQHDRLPCLRSITTLFLFFSLVQESCSERTCCSSGH